jgi:hypothetical protein
MIARAREASGCANARPAPQCAARDPRKTGPVKRTDLEKLQGKKLVESMRREPARDRYGAGAGGVGDRREQRKRDQAAGLVPFAVKLPADLIAALQERAHAQGTPLNGLVADLLRAALGADAGASEQP